MADWDDFDDINSFSVTLSKKKGKPWKAILLALFLFLVGSISMISGLVIWLGDYAHEHHGMSLFGVGLLMFMPGMYHTIIIYKAWRGIEGYSFSSLPEV
mmetsp:Transcript_19457/g.23280  ORF Transcript_19457/g.23280 Transcript_19457/m.23280 type:complete len:99 (-) Transcript_19457:536-832(-)